MRRPCRRTGWGVLVLALGCLAANDPAAPAASPEELFARGNERYTRADYAGAAEAYQGILQQGIRNSRVFYNLGNACFKGNRIGLAILYYERALKLDPTDPDARENLRFANLKIRDRIPGDEAPYLLMLLEQARDFLAFSTVTALFVGLYLAAMTAAAGWILARRGRWGPALGIVALAFSALALVAGGGMSLRAAERSAGDEAVVLAEKADVLSGPGAGNTLLASVHEGTKVHLHARRAEWFQVTLPDGRAGWIREASLGVI